MKKNCLDYQQLFQEVQLASVFSDSKTFPDCTPNFLLEEINERYLQEKEATNFDLAAFVRSNFAEPQIATNAFVFDAEATPQKHIKNLWNYLKKETPTVANDQSTYIALPRPFIVPGGRFQEIYYWDSYFTMLGLRLSDEVETIGNMVENFAYLIDTMGFVPNGNRAYFLSRSQPPFFASMVQLLAEIKGNETLAKYAQTLEKEYLFWMDGETHLKNGEAHRRLVKLPDGTLLNRYWDDDATPRPESYKEDVELAHGTSFQSAESLFLNIRAACESGWDFSTRWFKDVNDFGTIHTTDILPIDLNCLLWNLEITLSQAFATTEKGEFYKEKARLRSNAISTYFWKDSFFFDFDWKRQQPTPHKTIAAAFPLFFELATPQQAEGVLAELETNFLKSGGILTTLNTSGQQWDAPNGWAPLQWIAYVGLQNYSFTATAQTLRSNWLTLNERVFKETGKFTEKYNVADAATNASGGEYPNQDGFGWTNGVYLAMLMG